MDDFGVLSNFESIPLPTGMDVRAFDSLQKARKLAERAAKKIVPIMAATSGQVDLKSPSEMSFTELDSTIDAGLLQARDRLLPYLLEMRERLHAQGSRTDLPDNPKGLGWQAWVESKKALLGSLSSVNRMLAEATDEKKACPKCGKKRGHLRSCPRYVAPEPKKLSALESKFVDAAVKQHAALQDFYGGRTDAECALKSIIATIPAHDKLEEYCERGSEAVEIKEKLEEQNRYISTLGEEITRLNDENEALRHRGLSHDRVGEETTANPEHATYDDWQNHSLPALQFKLRYFEEASQYFSDRYHHAFQSSPFKKVLGMLKDGSEKVKSNADDFQQLAALLRGAVDNLNLLVGAIETVLVPSSGPTLPAPENVQPLPGAPDPAGYVEDVDGDIEAEPESLEGSDLPEDGLDFASPQARTGQQKPAPCSKMVYEASPGGPKVLEVPIPGKYRDDPPTLKYYVCHREKSYPYLTFGEAQAACDQIAGSRMD